MYLFVSIAVSAQQDVQFCIGAFIWELTNSSWGGLFDRQGKTTESIRIYDELWNFSR